MQKQMAKARIINIASRFIRHTKRILTKNWQDYHRLSFTLLKGDKEVAAGR
jgi:hypothetical protein